MLYFWCGRTMKFPMVKDYYNCGSNFKYVGHPEYLVTDFARRAIKEIDDSEVVSMYCINSPVFGQISPESLSGGVRMLIMLYSMNNIIGSGAGMGENCYPLLFEMSKEKDVYLHSITITDIPSSLSVSGFCVNTGEYIKTSNEFCVANALYDTEDFDYSKPLCKMWADRTLGRYLREYSLEDVVSGKCLLNS